MSKAVKGVGRALKKVVKGVVKHTKNSWSSSKKFAKSKVGKIIIAAVLIYFGGAALLGAMGGAGASGAGIAATASGAATGAGAGISGAWAGITSGTLSGAAGGLTGAYAAGAGAVAGTAGAVGAAAGGILSGAGGAGAGTAGTAGATGAAAGTTGASGSSILGLAQAPINHAALQALPTVTSGVAKTGLINGLMSSQYTMPALISSGTQLIGGAMQGKAAQQAADDEIARTDEEQATRSRNIGTRLWGG